MESHQIKQKWHLERKVTHEVCIMETYRRFKISRNLYYLKMKVITLNWLKGKLLLTVKTGCMVYGL